MSFDIRSFIAEVSDSPTEPTWPTTEGPIVVDAEEVLEDIFNAKLSLCEGEIVEITDEGEILDPIGETGINTIASLLQKNEESRVERYLRLSKNLTKKERRCLEQQLLKPEGIPPFVGHRATHSSIDDRSVKMIFESDEDFELFRRFFRVNSYKGQNTRDVDIIVALVEALDRGSLEYNATDKTLDFIADNGERIPL